MPSQRVRWKPGRLFMRPSATRAFLALAFCAPMAWAQQPPPAPEKPATAASPEPAKDDTSKPVAFREEVVVTAQKRSEAIADIPASVTVVTGMVLEQQRADDFQDLVPLIPGLSVTTTRPGSSRVTL